MYQKYVKRIIDFIISLCGIICLSPIFLIISIIIKATSKGNILFKQRRIGKNKKEFDILKFRTMKSDAPKDTPTHLLNNPYAYITPVGKFLRKTSLDEIPQLVNILKGQMSIVGPRPALYNQYDLIAERDKYGANDIAVGLTGLAQIKGRDELPIDVKAKYDGDYAQKISLLVDLKIFLITILKAINFKGVKEGGTGL